MLNELSQSLTVLVTLNILFSSLSFLGGGRLGVIIGLRFGLYALIHIVFYTSGMEVDAGYAWLWYSCYVVTEYIFARMTSDIGEYIPTILLTASMVWLCFLAISSLYGGIDHFAATNFVITTTIGIMLLISTHTPRLLQWVRK